MGKDVNPDRRCYLDLGIAPSVPAFAAISFLDTAKRKRYKYNCEENL